LNFNITARAQAESTGTTLFLFFEQKTAYEIGLGIPAEPLFRSGKRKGARLWYVGGQQF
jgi:hypothetical protein